MGNLCDSCFGGGDNHGASGNAVGSRDSYQTFPADTRNANIVHQPDPEEKRRQLAEAAEKRRQEQGTRGVQNVGNFQRHQKRQEEMERLEQEAAMRGDKGPGLRWQMS